MAEASPNGSAPNGSLIEAVCMMCTRRTYVRDGAEMFCPVCSSPLLELGRTSKSEAS